MPPSITITYRLCPPVVTDPGNLVSSKEMKSQVEKVPDDGMKVYYGALQSAIEEARIKIGTDLTAWRDMVGKAELSKETTKTLKYEEAEEEEEDGDDE